MASGTRVMDYFVLSNLLYGSESWTVLKERFEETDVIGNLGQPTRPSQWKDRQFT